MGTVLPYYTFLSFIIPNCFDIDSVALKGIIKLDGVATYWELLVKLIIILSGRLCLEKYLSTTFIKPDILNKTLVLPLSITLS